MSLRLEVISGRQGLVGVEILKRELLGWLKSELTTFLYTMLFRASCGIDLPRPTKKNNVLFILGSGSSVDSMTAEHWDVVSKHTSIGINLWALHPFTPNFFALEKIKSDRPEALVTLINDPGKASRAKVLWFGGPNRVNRQLLRVFKRRGGQVTFYSGWPLYLGADLKLVDRIRALSRVFMFIPRRFRPALDAGNTVSRLVTLGVLHGWKTIVLLGVDLGGAYFAEYERLMGGKKPSDLTGPKTLREKHATDSGGRGNFRVSKTLPKLDLAFRELFTARVLDGSGNDDRRLGLDPFIWWREARPQGSLGNGAGLGEPLN